MSAVTILIGDAVEQLRTLPSESVQMCVTSPPYWRLRRYGDDARELGQEDTPELYVAAMVRVFEEVRRALKPDGVLWLNIGDCYASDSKKRTEQQATARSTLTGGFTNNIACLEQGSKLAPGLKHLDLVGIPWMVAFALRAAGWYLRSDIVWDKKNCMPESVGRKNGKWTFKNGRPTRSHEYVFLLSKGNPYYYDSEAIAEPCVYDVDGSGTAARKARADNATKQSPTGERNGIRGGGFKDARKFDGKNGMDKQRGHSRKHAGFNERWDKMTREEQCTGMRNKRDVWRISPAQYKDAHFATFPADLIRPMILSGSKHGDTILDPFGGSGTVGEVGTEYGRDVILIDLYEKHRALQTVRCQTTQALALK